MSHLTFERISELAELAERVEGAESREHPPALGGHPADGHLAQCSQCRDTLRKVRGLIAAAHALPADIAPPPEVWAALQSRVGRKTAGRTRSNVWRAGWFAAAAVIVFAVGVAVLMPGPGSKAKASKLARRPATEASPILVLAVEKNYAATVAELRQTLETQRTTLSPATIRVLEHSLAAIDAAIAEAREALASDPANQTLVGILSSNYQRKVELLQRATQLPSSS